MKPNEELFSVQHTLLTPSTDHRGISKGCLLRRDICTDEYTLHKEHSFFITIVYKTPGEVDDLNDVLLHPNSFFQHSVPGA
jgi:hypothetical protein